MQAIKLAQLDYRYILINQYKELELNENELVILLLIDSLNKEKPSLVTGDQLAIRMTLKAEDIDAAIVNLMNKNFLSYESVNDALVTSMEKTYQKIIDLISKKVTEEEDIFDAKAKEDAMSKVMKVLEEELKRALTPLEIDLVSSWFKDGVNENVINNAINECILKNGKVSIKQVDRIIIKNLQHNDRMEEGFSSVDEKTKRDIKKAMDVASYDWVNK